MTRAPPHPIPNTQSTHRPPPHTHTTPHPASNCQIMAIATLSLCYKNHKVFTGGAQGAVERAAA